MSELKTFNTSALAELLHTTPNGICVLRYKIRKGKLPASALPKQLDLPSRIPLWDARDVQRWLDAHRPSQVGRPTKAEQIVRRQACSGEGRP